MNLELAYHAPYDWAWFSGFLARRVVAGVETVESGVYRRVVSADVGAGRVDGWIEVRDCPGRSRLLVALAPSLAGARAALRGRLAQVFDTDCPADRVVAALGALATPRPGIRVPGAFDGFELAVRAVLGQQVSVRAAHTLAGRLVERFGAHVPTPHAGLDRAFPEAHALASVTASEVMAIGVVGQRARALIALSEAVAQGRILLSPVADVASTVVALKALPGIGEWTAQYVAMRALRCADAFPAADLAVMKALGVRTAKAAAEAAERWRPWRAYAVMHLWDSLQPA